MFDVGKQEQGDRNKGEHQVEERDKIAQEDSGKSENVKYCGIDGSTNIKLFPVGG